METHTCSHISYTQCTSILNLYRSRRQRNLQCTLLPLHTCCRTRRSYPKQGGNGGDLVTETPGPHAQFSALAFIESSQSIQNVVGTPTQDLNASGHLLEEPLGVHAGNAAVGAGKVCRWLSCKLRHSSMTRKTPALPYQMWYPCRLQSSNSKAPRTRILHPHNSRCQIGTIPPAHTCCRTCCSYP